MTKLRNMIGVAFVAMSLLTGFAVSNAHAQLYTYCENACELELHIP